MLYQAKINRMMLFIYFLILAVLTIWPMFFSNRKEENLRTDALFWENVEVVLRYIVLGVLLIFLLSIFVTYQLKITENQLIYFIKFFNLVLYSKTVKPHQIAKITFKRSNWMMINAVVSMKKGFRISLKNFEPVVMYADMMRFANEHNISTEKTEEFQILQRIKENKQSS